MADLNTFAGITADMLTDFPDNTSGSITPAVLRTTVGDAMETTWKRLAMGQAVIHHADGSSPSFAQFTSTTAATRATELDTFLQSDLAADDRVYLPPGEYEARQYSWPSVACTIVGFGARWTVPTNLAYTQILSFSARTTLVGLEIDGQGDALSVSQTSPGRGVEFITGADGSRMIGCRVINLSEDTGANDPYGIFIERADHVAIINTDVIDSGYYSIHVKEADYALIDGCNLIMKATRSAGNVGVSFGIQSGRIGTVYKKLTIRNTHIEDEVQGLAGININAGNDGSHFPTSGGENTGYLESLEIDNVVVKSATAIDSSNRLKTTNVLNVLVKNSSFENPQSPTTGSVKAMTIQGDQKRNVLFRVEHDHTGGTFQLAQGSTASGNIDWDADDTAMDTAITAMANVTSCEVVEVSTGVWDVRITSPTEYAVPWRIVNVALTGGTYYKVQNNPSVQYVELDNVNCDSRIDLPKNPDMAVTIKNKSKIGSRNEDGGFGSIIAEAYPLRIENSTVENFTSYAIAYTAIDKTLTYPPRLELINSVFRGYKDQPSTSGSALSVATHHRIPANIYQIGCTKQNIHENRNLGDINWTDNQPQAGRERGFESLGHARSSVLYNDGSDYELPDFDPFAIGYELVNQDAKLGEPDSLRCIDDTDDASVWVEYRGERKNTASTSDATPVSCGEFATDADGTIIEVVARVVAIDDSNTDGAAYWLWAAFQRFGGTLTQIGSTADVATPLEDTGLSTAAATIDASSTTIRVRVTGIAGKTIAWSSFVTLRVRA